MDAIEAKTGINPIYTDAPERESDWIQVYNLDIELPKKFYLRIKKRSIV